MNQTTPMADDESPKKDSLPLWKAILLLILFAFMAVALFAAIVYLFISGAQQLGLPSSAMIAIFVIISGVFAWLVKRITDMVSSMSQRWFPEEKESDR
jgi:cation transporter-like permease